MTHSLPLFRKPPKAFTWRERVKNQLRVEEALRSFVKSATIKPDPNT